MLDFLKLLIHALAAPFRTQARLEAEITLLRHLALAKDAPLVRPVQRFGQVTAKPILGGLHHQYCRIELSAHRMIERG